MFLYEHHYWKVVDLSILLGGNDANGKVLLSLVQKMMHLNSLKLHNKTLPYALPTIELVRRVKNC